MNESVRIDCGICADLIPLVEDGVACEQSRKAVREHMSACADCRRKYGALEEENKAAQDNGKDDGRIIGRVRERVSGWMMVGVLGGLMMGVLTAAMSANVPWLMMLIFPAICGWVYLRGGRLWKWVPMTAMGIWVIVTLLASGGRLRDVPMAFVLGLIPLGLSYLGALAAALLKYAFKGEF